MTAPPALRKDEVLRATARGASLAAGPTAPFLLALVLSVPLLGDPPTFDELYHILAARGWLETGNASWQLKTRA